MTGRGRARSRGRARRNPEEDIRRPGEDAQPMGQVVGGASVQADGVRGASVQAGSGRDGSVQVGSGRGASVQAGSGRGAQAQGEDAVRGMQALQIQPSVGYSGKPVQLRANYFSVMECRNWIYYQYHVDFNPALDSTRMKKKVFSLLPQFKKKTTIFDGGILYLPKRMPEKVTEIMVGSPVDGAPIRVTVKEVREMSGADPETEKVYCVLLGRILENLLGMTFIGRNYYDLAPELEQRYPNFHLSIFPGYVTSIANYERGMLLCADVSHKILRHKSMWDLFLEVLDREGDDERVKAEIRSQYVGCTVITRYNNRTYKITDVDFSRHPMDSFPKADGTSITYVEYYKQHYNIDIIDAREQPLIVHRIPRRERRPGGPEFLNLIPQHCHMTGLTAAERTDFNMMRDIAKTTRVEPGPRAASLQQFVQRINSNPHFRREMEGLSFSRDMLEVTGRVLGREKIKVGRDRDGKEVELNFPEDKAEWNMQLRGTYLSLPVNLRNWVVLFPPRCSQTAELIEKMQFVGGKMGIQMDFPKMCQLGDDRIQSYDRALRETVNPSTQLVMCVLPNSQKPRYDHIKGICCVTNPVPSQCVVHRTIMNKQRLMSIATKIAIQINCKLGGFPWEVANPLARQAVMLVGIDTFHDSRTKNMSYGGVVCSTNPGFNCYYSKTLKQMPGEELLNGINFCLTAAMKKYHEKNNCFPKRIIVYRDGVGDGQVQAVLDHEKRQFLAAFDKLGLVHPENRPKLSIIIVKKRINTRFFLNNRNPHPGTIVDTDVTKPRSNVKYDYFCVSQYVGQGTVTPTHYNVVEDQNADVLTPDRMQQLTYKLTHLYYNWPGTIRVPAPCQYAHKLAFLTGQSLHRDPAEALSDRLFFL